MPFWTYHALAVLGTSTIVVGVSAALLWRPVVRPILIRWAIRQTTTPPRIAKRFRHG